MPVETPALHTPSRSKGIETVATSKANKFFIFFHFAYTFPLEGNESINEQLTARFQHSAAGVPSSIC